MKRTRYHQDDVVRFLELCNAYKNASENLGTEDGKTTFLHLSLQIHAAKSRVPKYIWGAASLSKRSREKWG